MNDPVYGALDLVSAPVVVLARNGRIDHVNRACAEWFALPRESSGSFWSLLPGANPEVQLAAEQVASGRLPVDIECDVDTATGPRHVAWSLVEHGEDRVVATGTDATACHRDLEALRAREERLRLLINAMPDPVFLKDGQGRWIDLNEAALATFELDHDESYRGHTDAELAERNPLYREGHLTCARTDEEAWHRRTLSRAEEVLPTRNGPPRIIDTYKLPLFHPDGSRKGLVILGRDITERVRAEQALRESEAQLRLILDTAPDLIGLVSADGTLEFANAALENLLDVPRERLIGRDIDRWPLFAPDGQRLAHDQRPYIRARKEGAVRGVEVAVDKRDGRRVVLMVNAASLPGPRAGVVFAATDVTRRTEIERMKSNFLELASHELRTPLTPLRLLLQRSRELVARGAAVDEQTVTRMERQVERLTDLVDELLEVARIERGLFVGAARSAVDLGSLVVELASDFRMETQAAISVSVPESGTVVWGNRVMLEQILSSLLDNAVKYGGNGIELELASTDEEVRVSVRDHGPGIAPEKQRNLFQRFHRSGDETTLRQPGLGLGLFMSRELLRELGSELVLETELGKGTTFSFTLPREHDAAGRVVPVRRPDRRPSSRARVP